MTCADCREQHPVMITESISIGKRVITWTICAACWLLAERLFNA